MAQFTRILFLAASASALGTCGGVDIAGRERPDEVVVIGGHLDSWDLGTGGIDDGAGVAVRNRPRWTTRRALSSRSSRSSSRSASW